MTEHKVKIIEKEDIEQVEGEEFVKELDTRLSIYKIKKLKQVEDENGDMVNVVIETNDKSRELLLRDKGKLETQLEEVNDILSQMDDEDIRVAPIKEIAKK
jgi:hypothetical protein